MPQLIDFSNYQPENTTVIERKNNPASSYSPVSAIDITDDEYKLTLNVLVHHYPGKTNFTIEEVAAQLGVGREFIRRRIKSGQIKAINYGDKPMVLITELTRILTKGLK